jgi:preprotein translocase subunit SecD
MKKGKGLENGLSAVVILAVIGVSLFFLYPPDEQLKLGLDLQGGVEVVLEADLPPNATVDESEDTVSRIITILENRINEFGLSNVVLSQLGADRILVQLPGTQNIEEARSLIGARAPRTR